MQVLHSFPTTIRRRILRHLYLKHVRAAYLFKGVRQKFLDALLSVARIELFMPQVPWTTGQHRAPECHPHLFLPR